MIYSPVEIEITCEGAKRAKKMRGVLLDKSEITKVIKLIDRSTVNGLKGGDAVLLVGLKRAASNLLAK